jgi:small-conductance mechanosensitive channel/CRP-like cAMP-binding protein
VTHYSIAVGVAAFVLVLGLRAATLNTVIRRKLGFSAFLLAGFAALSLIPESFWAGRAQLEAQVHAGTQLLFVLAAINALVTLIVNPLRADRVPDRFPIILQDSMVIAGFLVVGSIAMPDKWLALSAVGGFVIGFALQDTLGNMFAGLAVQVEKPFHVGDWIAVAGHEGVVTEITWRATRLRTRPGTQVVIPNNVLSKEAFTNFSKPDPNVRLFVDVGVTYDAPPNDVKRVLLDALANVEIVLRTPPPVVVVTDFAAYAIAYRVKFWVADYGADDDARDRVRTAVYYALRRAALEIPFPIQVEYRRGTKKVAPDERLRRLEAATQTVDLLASLEPPARAELLSSARERLYGAGEAIVRQGDAGASMFVVCRGEVRVTIEPGAREVARIPAGGYFGEMSLLTGEARTATVSAVTDALTLEITADDFRRLALSHPAVVEQVTLVVAARREGLERAREAASAASATGETQRTLLSRVQAFLKLPVWKT